MAKAPKTVENAPAAPAIEPLTAIHKIVYGKQKHAPAGSLFRPSSEAERAELLNMGAAREPSEVETALAAQVLIDDGEPVVPPAADEATGDAAGDTAGDAAADAAGDAAAGDDFA